MTHETASALAELSRRLFETEQKLDNYFRMLHDDNAAKLEVLAVAADDQMAVRGIGLYPEWEVGLDVKVGDRLQYDGKLYKCRQAHTTAEHQPPSTATASLWKVIDEQHAGTLADPIPYDINMTVYKDKYYTYDGVTYKCLRDSGQPLYAEPASLVGNYFEVV